MRSYAEAVALLREAARARLPPAHEEVPLAQALGRVAAVPVLSAEPVPPFDNSAMDGYALAAAKAATVPARLTVLGTVMAGDAPRCAVESGGAWRIMTGAPMPAGCDAVVPVERTREKDGAVEILQAPEPGDYVRGAGQDFPAGAQVCPAGTRLGARHLLALAAVGVARAKVLRRPRVALIATGRELASPGAPLRPGMIRDASSAYLGAAVPRLGADFENLGVVADDPADFRNRFIRALGGAPDLILSTGAVSMGAADFIPAALKELGAEVLFHKAAIRPGKPVFAARFPKGPLFLGLPGNPISTVVGLRFFAEPYLRAWMGRPDEAPCRSALVNDVAKPDGLRCFFKARRHQNGGIEVLSAQASFQIHSMLSADCWAALDETGDLVKAGTSVEVYPLSESLA